MAKSNLRFQLLVSFIWENMTFLLQHSEFIQNGILSVVLGILMIGSILLPSKRTMETPTMELLGDDYRNQQKFHLIRASLKIGIALSPFIFMLISSSTEHSIFSKGHSIEVWRELRPN
jgi:hypothetical protein